MAKKKTLTKAQERLKQRVLNAYRKRGGFRYVPPEWDKKLWKKSTDDIHEFIDGRFADTLDVVEYYSAMVFLWKTLPNKELLVEFHDSPQWREAAKTYQDCAGTSKHLNEKNASNTGQHGITEIDSIKANGIKTIPPIQFIGDKK